MPKAKKGKQKAGEESGPKVQAPQSKVTVAPALVTQFPGPVIQSSHAISQPHVTQSHGNHQHVTRALEGVTEEEEEADDYGGLGDIAEDEEWGEEMGRREEAWGTPRIQTSSKDGWGGAVSTGWGAQHTPASAGTPKVVHKKANIGWVEGEPSAAANNDWSNDNNDWGNNNNDRDRWSHPDGGDGGDRWEDQYDDEEEDWGEPQPAARQSAPTGWMNWGEEARKLTSKVTFSTAPNPAHNNTVGTRNPLSLQQHSQIVNSLLNRPNQNNQHSVAPPTGQPKGWNSHLSPGHRQQQQLQQLQLEHAVQQQRQQEQAYQQQRQQEQAYQQYQHQPQQQQPQQQRQHQHQHQQPQQQHQQHHQQQPHQQHQHHHQQQPHQQHQQHQQQPYPPPPQQQHPHEQHEQHQQPRGKKNKKNKKQKKEEEENQHEDGGWEGAWGDAQKEDLWDMDDRRASTYEMPSKTLSYARQGTDTSINIRPVRNQMQDYADMRFIESKGAALAPVQQALFSQARPAKSRFHWLFPPDKDERVASLLAWIQSMSYDLASFGLHKFLQSRERGALIVNADYRPTKSPNEPAFDWLTFDQLQLTLDRVLQESVAYYDPAVQVIVFVFLPSQSGNSMAIWRRKVAVPNNLRLAYQAQIKQALAALRKEYVLHVDELPGDEPISPLVENTRKKGKKSSWWKRMFTIDW